MKKGLRRISLLLIILAILSGSIEDDYGFCPECGANKDVMRINIMGIPFANITGIPIFKSSKIGLNAFSFFMDPKHQCKHDKMRYQLIYLRYLLGSSSSRAGGLKFLHFTDFEQDSPFFLFLSASQKRNPDFRNTIYLLLSDQAQTLYPEWDWETSIISPESELLNKIDEEYQKFLQANFKDFGN